MKLTIKERFGVMGLLPPEANWVTRRLIRDLLTKVGFSAEEHEKFGFHFEGEGQNQQIRWNPEAAEEVEFDFAGPETKLIVEGLQKLDAEKKLTAEHDTLCEKFLTAE